MEWGITIDEARLFTNVSVSKVLALSRTTSLITEQVIMTSLTHVLTSATLTILCMGIMNGSVTRTLSTRTILLRLPKARFKKLHYGTAGSTITLITHTEERKNARLHQSFHGLFQALHLVLSSVYKAIYTHPTASQYVAGMAFHWYDLERYMDGIAYHERLNDTHFVDPSRRAESRRKPVRRDAPTHGRRKGFRDSAHVLLYPALFQVHSARLAAREDAPGRAVRDAGGSQLLRAYPAALAMCVDSARQTLHRTTDGKIQVTGTNFCLSLVYVEWQGHEIQMVECTFTSQSWTFEDETGRIRADKFCLSLNHASTENNVWITARPCKLSLEPSQQ
ncbi:hypothetical protein PsorP6_009418 [Peronosclerospora sorghi]|uniref:Uncharacterized protein n=1 Tax=Peronosclerospora sorghi TaxID=230839 RepID=A0ACC0W1B1_9STRA|nr:hypothetical protein PsorP6_009418 [Peronosclerospora sorghi]